MTELILGGFGLALRMAAPSSLAADVVESISHCLSRSVDRGAAEFSLIVRPPVGERFEVELDGASFFAESRKQLLVALASRVESLIAEHSPTHIFVHSGVARLGECLIVLPGASHAGKSTAVAALVQAGATYWSDEFAPVDHQGFVVPFPRRLNRRTRAGTERLPMVIPVDRSARPVDRVIFTAYEPQASYQPRGLSRGEALLGLLEQTVPARQRPAEAMESLGRLVATARVESGTRGEAEDFARALFAQA